VLVGARIQARNVIPDKSSRKSLARRQSEIINRLSDRTSIAICVTRVTARANVIVNTVLIYRLIGEITPRDIYMYRDSPFTNIKRRVGITVHSIISSSRIKSPRVPLRDFWVSLLKNKTAKKKKKKI